MPFTCFARGPFRSYFDEYNGSKMKYISEVIYLNMFFSGTSRDTSAGDNFFRTRPDEYNSVSSRV